MISFNFFFSSFVLLSLKFSGFYLRKKNLLKLGNLKQLEVLISESEKISKIRNIFIWLQVSLQPILLNLVLCNGRHLGSKIFLILRLNTFFDKNKNTFCWSVVCKKYWCTCLWVYISKNKFTSKFFLNIFYPGITYI